MAGNKAGDITGTLTLPNASQPMVVRRGKARTYIGEGTSEKRISPTEVRDWFAGAVGGKRLTIPRAEACERIAKSLNAMLDLGEPPQMQPVLGETKRYGRQFLNHLTNARKIVERLRPGLGDREKILTQMDHAKSHVQAVLNISDFPVLRWSWHQRARAVAELARKAWCTTGRSPSAKNPNDPLCLFVTSAMRAIGYRASPEAVSEALRGRRGLAIRRKGKSRSVNRP